MSWFEIYVVAALSLNCIAIGAVMRRLGPSGMKIKAIEMVDQNGSRRRIEYGE